MTARLVNVPGNRLSNISGVRQMPFALALTLTRTAQAIQKSNTALIGSNLTIRRKFILRGVAVQPATKQRLIATTFVRSGRGEPGPAEFLRANEFGGLRRFKRFEKALQRAGILEPHEFAIPADGGSIDLRGDGNTGGQYTKLLSGLRALAGDPFTRTASSVVGSARTKTGKVRKRRPATYWRAGQFIWERINGKARPLLIIVRAPQYRARLKFAENAEIVAKREIGRIYIESTARAFAGRGDGAGQATAL